MFWVGPRKRLTDACAVSAMKIPVKIFVAIEVWGDVSHNPRYFQPHQHNCRQLHQRIPVMNMTHKETTLRLQLQRWSNMQMLRGWTQKQSASSHMHQTWSHLHQSQLWLQKHRALLQIMVNKFEICSLAWSQCYFSLLLRSHEASSMVIVRKSSLSFSNA